MWDKINSPVVGYVADWYTTTPVVNNPSSELPECVPPNTPREPEPNPQPAPQPQPPPQPQPAPNPEVTGGWYSLQHTFILLPGESWLPTPPVSKKATERIA